MADMKTKKITQVSDTRWPYTEKGRDGGKDFATTEVPIKCEGNRGIEEMILRSSSGKLLDAVKAGVSVTGYIFKDEKADRFPETWRLSALAKNNPDLVGAWGGGGGAGTTAAMSPYKAPERAQEARGGGQAAQRTEYTFSELVALFSACYDEVRMICGKEFNDEALQDAAATLFNASRQGGIRGGDAEAKPAATGGMNGNMQQMLVHTIEDAIVKLGMWDTYQAAGGLDEATLMSLWQSAGDNETAFAAALKVVLATKAQFGGTVRSDADEGRDDSGFVSASEVVTTEDLDCLPF